MNQAHRLRTLFRNLCLVVGLALALCLSGGQTALAKFHIDRQAGIKFEVPFKTARILNQDQVEALLKRQLGERLPADVRYTSAVFGEGNVPYILIWTRPARGSLSRDLVDMLSAGATDRADATAGLSNFLFNKQLLRGEGAVEDSGDLKVKVLLQLVRDRYTYLGYYYANPEQLADFEQVKKTLKVGRISRLSYQTLPQSASTGLGWLSWLVVVATAFSAGALAGGCGYYLYRQWSVQKRQPPPVPRTDGLPQQVSVGPLAADDAYAEAMPAVEV